jgi:HK97 family phage major capsid protein
LGDLEKKMKRQSVYLKESRDQKIALMDSILEATGADKPMNDQQRAMFDELDKEVKILDSDIRRHIALEDAKAAADTQSSRPGRIEIVDAVDRQPKSIVPANQMRYSKLKAFTGENANEDAYKAGMWALATLWNRADAQRWCKEHDVPMVHNAALESGNTTGGFLVPDQLERAIIDLRESYGLFRQLARIRPMSSDFMTIPRRAGGLTAYAIGEGADFTDSTKPWTAVNLTARKWGVLAKYSSEIAEDAIINIGDDLASEVAYAFAVAEDNAGFNGDGSATYHGITGVVTKFTNQVSGGTSTFAGALDATSGHDLFSEIDATDLTNLMAKLPLYAIQRPDCAWICSQPAWATVFQRLQAAAGGNTKTDVAGRMMDSYLGYPIFKSQAMPTSTGTLADKCMLLFGSPSAAMSMGTRRGVTLAVSADRYFESDQIAIRGTERFDINVHDIGDTVTAGPLVALIGN